MGKFKAPPISSDIYIKVNGTQYGITYADDDEVYSWEALQNKNNTKYTISNGKVVWNDGTILQYNGIDVLPTDVVVEAREYTTRTNTPSGSSHKLTFDSNITITVNGSSVTTSPYNLTNGDVITATTGGGYKISINGTLYGGESTININNQDINIVRSTAETFDVLLVTINYTETSTPTYSFKHWKKSNVVVNRTLVGEKYYYFKPYTILGLYRIDTTLTNCTGASANATKIQENGGLTLTFTANTGYELPTGVSVTNVTSYNWNKSTGVLAISKPTGDVTIEIVAVSALPQLSTPTNVAVTDTTLTFDEVANATSYEVFVDNVSIGTHTIESGETWLLNESLGMATLSKTSVTFTSNNENFVSIAYSTSSMGPKTLWYYKNDTEYVVACEYGTYSNEAYRTITFENAPTGDLLTWLNDNGTKQ